MIGIKALLTQGSLKRCKIGRKGAGENDLYGLSEVSSTLANIDGYRTIYAKNCSEMTA